MFEVLNVYCQNIPVRIFREIYGHNMDADVRSSCILRMDK